MVSQKHYLKSGDLRWSLLNLVSEKKLPLVSNLALCSVSHVFSTDQ